jgi:hypothetical protein
MNPSPRWFCHNRDLFLIDARHRVDLVGVLRCRWCLVLHLQKLLLEVGDSLHPLLKLSILCLDGFLEMHDCVGAGVHLLPCKVKLLMGVVQPMLGHAKMTVCDLQL